MRPRPSRRPNGGLCSQSSASLASADQTAVVRSRVTAKANVARPSAVDVRAGQLAAAARHSLSALLSLCVEVRSFPTH